VLLNPAEEDQCKAFAVIVTTLDGVLGLILRTPIGAAITLGLGICNL
jgi:hypothetical protein